MGKMTRRELVQVAAAAVVTAGSDDHVKASETAPDDRRGLYTGSPIEIYTNTLSAAAGEEVTIHVSTTARRFNLEIARVGLEETLVWTRKQLRGAFYPTPKDASNNGCRWPVAMRLKIPAEWRSGYYQIKATTADEGASGAEYLAFVVVRAAKPAAKILLVLATNTYHAYNDYGGGSSYILASTRRSRGKPAGAGEYRTSFHRPWMPGFLWRPEVGYSMDEMENMPQAVWDHRLMHKQSGLSVVSMAAGFHNWERVMVRWLEKHGYAVDYAVSSDLESHSELLGSYRLMLSVGHDEYWSAGMRDTVESFIASGGNVCFFSGNVAVFQVRYEDQGRTMVCYKQDFQEDPYFKSGRKQLTATYWISPHVARPESRMTGLSCWYAGLARFGGATPQGPGGYLVYRPEHWVFNDSGLTFGDCVGQKSMIIHYEVDGCPIRMENSLPYPVSDYDGPPTLEILGMVPAIRYPGADGNARLGEFAKRIFGDSNSNALAHVSANRGHAVMGIYTNNGTVFCAGTTDWTSGLTGKDPAVERVTKNLLDRLST